MRTWPTLISAFASICSVVVSEGPPFRDLLHHFAHLPESVELRQQNGDLFDLVSYHAPSSLRGTQLGGPTEHNAQVGQHSGFSFDRTPPNSQPLGLYDFGTATVGHHNLVPTEEFSEIPSQSTSTFGEHPYPEPAEARSARDGQGTVGASSSSLTDLRHEAAPPSSDSVLVVPETFYFQSDESVDNWFRAWKSKLREKGKRQLTRYKFGDGVLQTFPTRASYAWNFLTKLKMVRIGDQTLYLSYYDKIPFKVIGEYTRTEGKGRGIMIWSLDFSKEVGNEPAMRSYGAFPLSKDHWANLHSFIPSPVITLQKKLSPESTPRYRWYFWEPESQNSR